MLWLLGLAIAVVALSSTAAALALMLGGPRWGAAFGLLVLATAPLPVLPLLLDALARRQGRLLGRRRRGATQADRG